MFSAACCKVNNFCGLMFNSLSLFDFVFHLCFFIILFYVIVYSFIYFGFAMQILKFKRLCYLHVDIVLAMWS